MSRNCIVTGAAGFIGSRLCGALLDSGDRVVGLDCFTDYYDVTQKERNVRPLLLNDNFRLVREDLLTADLASLLDKTDVVFHLAAQPGVRKSWGKRFEDYVQNNVQATQRLLEAIKDLSEKGDRVRLVYASSSSIYGDAEQFPTTEDACPKPVSPYGVTKLAGEHLVRLYYRSFGLEAVSLRYFTVYGPGQRPDMAFFRFIRAITLGGVIEVYGDGDQSRDFTYVDDVVAATMAAAEAGQRGRVFNIGGGNRVTVNQVISEFEDILGQKAKVEYKSVVAGDVRDTEADTGLARELLGYKPATTLRAGLEQQAAWVEMFLGETA